MKQHETFHPKAIDIRLLTATVPNHNTDFEQILMYFHLISSMCMQTHLTFDLFNEHTV